MVLVSKLTYYLICNTIRMKGGDALGQRVDYRYINRYANENYDRITILVPKGSKRKIQMAAKQLGTTMSDYIVSLIPQEFVGEWKSKELET